MADVKAIIDERPDALPNSVSSQSEASKFILRVLKKLQRVIAADPEVDLLSKFPSEYSDRLAKRKEKQEREKTDRNGLAAVLPNVEEFKEVPMFPEEDIRSRIRPSDTAIVQFPLSDEVMKYLARDSDLVDGSAPQSRSGLSWDLLRLLQQSEPLWSGPFPRSRMVFKCGLAIAIKIVRHYEDFTEYTSLQYLERYKPNVPAPRPLGCILMSGLSIIFMTYVPEMTLEEAWTQSNETQKISVQYQLVADGITLGGVAGEGCKDLRRNLRHSAKPITSIEAFEDLQFSNPHFGGSVFIKFLRRLPHPGSSESVFTHGDVRPANIMVKFTKDGHYLVTGIIDWENSGFYPEHYESTKITNCMATNEEWDWYLFLPPCISPVRYPTSWLLDRLWGTHIQ
ncbi:MAG: hypothetical protein M4579_001270 [Chaenotheca gracillima]|nr:MAG: hypothetical protein M4579_001270 [Chaenotheca gracillima]